MSSNIEPKEFKGIPDRYNNTTLPYNIQHPEMNLIPLSEFEKYCSDVTDLYWGLFDYRPDYVECPNARGKTYLYIVRKGKVGIAWGAYKQNFWGIIKYRCGVVITCKYDRIEKHPDMFVCHKENDIYYVDLQGNIMR